MRRMMLVVMALAVFFGGCASQAVRTARDEAEIERLKLENEYLRKRVEQGISVTGTDFSAELPACADPRLVEILTSEKAAKAETIRLKNRVIAQTAARESASNVSREETKLHFWIDEMGQEWVRGYIRNITPNKIVQFRADGISGTIPQALNPGDTLTNLWALAGTKVFIAGEERDLKGKFLDKLSYSTTLRSSGVNPVDKIDEHYYQWAIVVGGR